ncbi:MAG: Bifunctional purine biosynthesis protein PurH [Phycisphaerae bacterium]|nr:Bifunctional purine biosynthesis protein PurH [Phycisphaerae bacterium]
MTASHIAPLAEPDVDLLPVRRALLSVSDKTGLAEFAAALARHGATLISTGGTAKAIAAGGLPVTPIESVTGFPECLDGRVKTLHPKVHGGLLGRPDLAAHRRSMDELGIQTIDLVCVNLYPFTQTISRPGVSPAEAIENIDIGGPSMVRSAAKNHAFVAIVTDPSQYAELTAELDATGGKLSMATRRKLAGAAYALTASYDAAIAAYFRDVLLRPAPGADACPARLTVELDRVAALRYGENPHQAAALYRSGTGIAALGGVANAKHLIGSKEISFNNYVDADAACELVREFADPAAVVIKHTNPAGAAVGADLVEAYRRAYLGDANAAMGGIIAFNRPVDAALADAVMNSYARWGKAAGAGGFFAEVVIAPSFDDDAVELIRTAKKWGAETRLLATGPLAPYAGRELQFKSVTGGVLVMQRDYLGLDEAQWKVVSKAQPAPQQLDDLRFAWLLCKHVKSNAIVLARGRTLLGAGAGQMSRVTSSRLAGELARASAASGGDLSGCVLASDAFFPFRDGVDAAVAVGVTAMIEPGGSKKDDEVIAAADEHGIPMIFTGTRHFRHG